jgi:predicted RNA binding protein YcfA (HicA-like mRNA interferase family)
MTRLPRLNGKQVVTALRRAGLVVVRVKGSHHYMKHPDGRATVVPVHAGETLGPGLMAKILSDCEMTREEIRRLL